MTIHIDNPVLLTMAVIALLGFLTGWKAKAAAGRKGKRRDGN